MRLLWVLVCCTLVVSSARGWADSSQNFLRAEEAAYRPSFSTAEGSRAAGTAFILRYKDQFFAITAHHLFSQAGGFNRDYRWNELAELISGIELSSLSQPERTVTGTELLPVPGADAVNADTGKHDIAIFRLDEQPEGFVTLSARVPRIGESVWLCAALRGSTATVLMHKATITEYNRNWISYRFDDASLNLGATSGSALVNDAGEVYGVNLAGGPEPTGLFGYGNPLVSLRETLAAVVADTATDTAKETHTKGE